MQLLQKYPVLGSSANPEKIALTIKGALVTITPAVIMLAGWLKIDLGAEEWQNTVEMLWKLTNEVILVVGMATTVFGALRKIYYKIRFR